MTSVSERVLYSAGDGIARLTINRPEKLNALDRQTMREIDAVVGRARDDAQVGVLLVCGAGEKAFVAGADIKAMANQSAMESLGMTTLGQRVARQIELLAKPVIAAVNGFAFGGGCELALACHMRLASENAVLGLPEVSLGIIPGYGGTQRLPRLVGPGRALELILSGRRIKAEEAERIGLVNRVVPREQLLDEALRLAQSILKNGPLAVTAALEAVRRGLELPLEAGLRLESGLFGILAASEDMHEGLKAFLEKRPPSFRRK